MVPPTPPIGLIPPNIVSPAAGTVAAPRPAAPDFNFGPPGPPPQTPAPPPHQPPQAPKANLGATLVDPRPPSMDEGAKRVCHVCAKVNAPMTRYCETCGSTLQPPLPKAVAAAPVPQTTALMPAHPQMQQPQTPSQMQPPQQMPPPQMQPMQPPPQMPPRASSPPAPAAQIVTPHAAPIQPGRVVDIGRSSASVETVRVCGRCRGSSEATAQFCKFCGSSLADTQPVPSSAVPTPRPGEVPTSSEPSPNAQRAPAAPPAASPAPAPPTPPPPPPPPAAVQAPPPPPPPPAPAHAQAPAPLPPPVLPAPAVASAPPRGRLVVVAKDGGEGPSYPLLDQVDIGRAEGNIVIADDKYLSPRHGRLVRRNGQLFLRDLASVNGIYLRLSPARTTAASPGAKPNESEVQLRDQDLFLVGQQVIRFEIVRDAEEGLGPAVEHGTLLFGTPIPRLYARLCQRSIEGVTRDVYYLAKRETVLGRESGDIVFTEDPFLSRRHAAIRAQVMPGLPAPGAKAAGKDAKVDPREAALSEPRVSLVDLGSSNGSYIQIRGEVPLHDGDQFRIGQQLFRVDLTQDAPVLDAQAQPAPGTVGT